MLDQFPSTSDTQLVTQADLRAEVARLDHRIDLLEANLRGEIHKAIRTQTIWMIATIITVLGLMARTNLFG